MKHLMYAVIIVASATTTSTYAQKKNYEKENYKNYKKEYEKQLEESASSLEYVNVQDTILVQKSGLILLCAKNNSKDYSLENSTTDTISVQVLNHQRKVEELPGEIMVVSGEEHQEQQFTIAPGKKVYLGGIICIHSIGLQINNKELIYYKFFKN